MHVSCHERLQIAEMLPIFKYNGLAYVIIENAVVRNAHNEQKPSRNVSTMTQHTNACIRNAVFMSYQKRLQLVEAFRKVQNEQKRARIPNTLI